MTRWILAAWSTLTALAVTGCTITPSPWWK